MIKKTNVLILGSGGREHAIAWKIKQSDLLNRLYVAPGNSGTKNIATNLNVKIDDYTAIKNIIITKKIELLIVGPEAPLVRGLHDQLLSEKRIENLKIIGPQSEGAQLEGSKLFAKNFMKRHNIPTANFKSFTKEEPQQAICYLKTSSPPFVIKANGLASGKGVFICNTLNEALAAIDDILVKSKFGESGSTIVIESFLTGIELSVFILTDGHSYKILPSAKDYKRIGDGDTGLNTGGMGAVSPVTFLDERLMEKIKLKIIEPTLFGLKKENIEYKGFLFFGLIRVGDEPFVIEYNVRLGDPETQTIIPRIQSDLLKLLLKINSSENFEKCKINISDQATATVILSSGGYPEKFQKGHLIQGMNKVKDSLLFHAGLKSKNAQLITNGGRVLAITSFGKTLAEATKKSYINTNKIQFKNAYFRKDIGADLII